MDFEIQPPIETPQPQQVIIDSSQKIKIKKRCRRKLLSNNRKTTKKISSGKVAKPSVEIVPETKQAKETSSGRLSIRPNKFNEDVVATKPLSKKPIICNDDTNSNIVKKIRPKFRNCLVFRNFVKATKLKRKPTSNHSDDGDHFNLTKKMCVRDSDSDRTGDNELKEIKISEFVVKELDVPLTQITSVPSPKCADKDNEVTIEKNIDIDKNDNVVQNSVMPEEIVKESAEVLNESNNNGVVEEVKIHKQEISVITLPTSQQLSPLPSPLLVQKTETPPPPPPLISPKLGITQSEPTVTEHEPVVVTQSESGIIQTEAPIIKPESVEHRIQATSVLKSSEKEKRRHSKNGGVADGILIKEDKIIKKVCNIVKKLFFISSY